MVINEALSQGLPVITTDKCIAGLELINSNENGFIVKCENKNELLEATKCFFTKREQEIDLMKMQSLEKIKEYTIENMVKQQINVFRRNL